MFDDNMADFVRRLEALRVRISESGGVLTIRVKELKELYGAGRLGVQVRERISEGLNYNHIYFLGDLPNDERAEVRLYLKGSKVGRILEAAGALGPAADQQLRAFARGDQASELNNLAREIRELLVRYTETTKPAEDSDEGSHG